MRSKTSLWHIISLLILLVIGGGVFLSYGLHGELLLWPPPIADHRSSAYPLWVLKDIHVNPKDQTQLTTVGGKLILIGSNNIRDPGRLIALDESTGKFIWQYGSTDENVLAASSAMAFAGEVGRVTTFDPNDGKVIWSTPLPFTRSVTKLLVRDDVLYVDTVSANLFLLDRGTGRILQTMSYGSADVPTWSNHRMDLAVIGNSMYFQKPSEASGSEQQIIALDGSSGNQLWSSTVRPASRIVGSPLGVFVLTLDGRLLRFDPENGSIHELLQFTPPPVQRHYSEGGTARDYGYHVAIDGDNRLVFVYLGDGAQLFAYQLEALPR